MRSLGLALAAGALALTATGAAQAVVPPGRAPSIAAAHGVAVGAYPARAPIELYVRLQGRNEAQLDALIAALDTPGSNAFGRFLTPEQFGAYFGAAPRAYATAIGSLRRGGFIVEALPANRTDIIVRAPAATVSAYFQTPIDLRSENGRLFYANRFEPIVPAELGAEAISGLDDYGMHHPEFLRRPASTINGYFSWGPPDIAAAYDLDALYKSKPVLDGSGVTIANATCGAASDSDFATFQKQFPELSRAHLISTAIGGKLQTGCGRYGNGESSLDVDSATGVARGATFHQVVARDSSNGAFDKVYSYIVNNLGSTVHVVTTSWGICEREIQGTPSLTIDEKLYRQAAAEGQAWFSASGDSGTDDCGASKGAVSVDYPGSSPYVVSVGGTNVKASIVHGNVAQWLAESTWQYSNSNGASGGGRSILYAKPSYQMGMTPKDGARDVPDVALLADDVNDGMWVADGGRLEGGWGGTSEAAPQWAGLLAIIVQRNGNKAVTDPHVRLYALAAGRSYAKLFHDITKGTNAVPAGSGYGAFPGYTAGPGFDLCTGLGSFIGAALVKAY